LAEVAGLPWGTVTFAHCRGKGPQWYFRLLAGPARYAKAGWQLPVCEDIDIEASSEEIRDQVREFREEWGFASRQVGLDETARAEGSDAQARTEVNGIDSRPQAMKRRMTRGSMGDFMKPLQPSPTLAAIVGSEPQVRTELTSKIWNYIVENNLQDPVNRRMLNCDDKLRAVVRFADDPEVENLEAGLTCERCALQRAECGERLAPATLWRRESQLHVQQKALAALLESG